MGSNRNIEDYALIGDCETAALVSRTGSIDWLCWPRFDSPACFASLLGREGQGSWELAPLQASRVERRYRKDSLILETDHETPDGAATVIDFMPERTNGSTVVRLVAGRQGSVTFRTRLTIRFDYGSIVPWLTQRDGVLVAIGGPDKVALHTPVPVRSEGFSVVGEFSVQPGECIPLVLSYQRSFENISRPIAAPGLLEHTEALWAQWAERMPEFGRWTDAVHRSLITLKALTFRRTGGIVAAPTTSLPERLGGARNWDYRYCWLRDATFSLLALINSGLHDEAREWREWLLRAIAGDPAKVQIMYNVTGERRLDEWTVDGLDGFANSSPVRIGNAAARQLQIDIYGELMDALHQARCSGLPASRESWNMELGLIGHLEKIWREPDNGIWEVRGPRRQFTHSKVMAWVAFDRAIKSAERFGLNGPIAHWRRIAETIRNDVLTQGFNASRGAFVQYYGSEQLDASLLLLPLVGFLHSDDPRMQKTVRAIERELMENGLVRRYLSASGIDGTTDEEGAFLPCTLWLADNYVLAGRRDDAIRMLDRVLSLRNDVGLLSEEYDPRGGQFLGNFPQAFSHVALVNTIHNLTLANKPGTQRFRDRVTA